MMLTKMSSRRVTGRTGTLLDSDICMPNKHVMYAVTTVCALINMVCMLDNTKIRLIPGFDRTLPIADRTLGG